MDGEPVLTPRCDLLPCRDSQKKWCRTGDWSTCLLTGSEGSYDDTSVAIRDDGSRTFTVTLKNLQMKDTGWYWCCAGQHKEHVHVIVTPRPSTSRSTNLLFPLIILQYSSMRK